jgi:S1-C subfamily serine protease
MKHNYQKVVFYCLLSLVLLFTAACGASPSEATQAPSNLPTDVVEPTATQPAEPTVEPTAEPTSPPEPESGAINSISAAQQAIVQIEAQGSFVDPQFGQVYNSAGRGSGFIIDPSGLAVTNNHVVTGSGLLKVWVGGDQSKTYNARVVGVSECSDLALIDIEGDGFPYLAWSQNPVDVGTDIYVAGFPLGDPEYSLTKGIISKAKANGETGWASVDSVIEYDATTNPGNSGGPVLTQDAKIVGVHYAGNGSTRQAFGIGKDTAEQVVNQLKQGKDLDSLGINGQAILSDDGSLSGIWISSVKSGSPADKAGLQGGDLLTTLENLILSTDGTMADYCDIIRSHSPSDTLNVEALRLATGEILQGQINGREMEVVSVLDMSGSDDGQTDNSNSGQDSGSTSPSGELNLDASAPGDVIYSSDFDALLSDWVYFLMSGEEDGFSATIDNSKLHIEIPDQNVWVYFYMDAFTVADVRLDTKVENLGKNTNNVSLFCRYSEDRGWYEFNVANNGEYNIYYYDAVTSQYNVLFSGGSREINMGKGTNEYTVICDGDSLTLGINGTEVRTVKDTRLKEGRVGLSVSSFDITPIVVEYDYFVASVP